MNKVRQISSLAGTYTEYDDVLVVYFTFDVTFHMQRQQRTQRVTPGFCVLGLKITSRRLAKMCQTHHVGGDNAFLSSVGIS